jgi:signal transduction histidine kinase
MYLPDDKTDLAHDLIAKLYSRPFDESLVTEAAHAVTLLIDSHYFGLYLATNDRSRPMIISNNTPEFVSAYRSVAKEDFLLESVVSDHRECVLHRIRRRVENEPDKQNFISAVQNARPISDIVYLPIKIGEVVVGHWSLARAGLNSPIYTKDQLEAFRFVGNFLNDAFQRSLLPPPLVEETAYLDYHGHFVAIGAKIREAFDEIFGFHDVPDPRSSYREPGKNFLDGYRRFLLGPFQVGMDRLTLHTRERTFFFLFKLLRPKGLPLRNDRLPYASVSLLDQPFEQDAARAIGLRALARTYSFTAQESYVLLGIFTGRTCKEIATSLGIDESVVTYCTDTIYEKTGFRSRVDLVLGLSGNGTSNSVRKALDGSREMNAQADNLEALGLLAAQVGHEINTPNHVIALNASLLESLHRKFREDRARAREDGLPEAPENDFSLGEAEPLVKAILKASGQINQVLADLRSEVRPLSPPVPVDLGLVVRQTAATYESEWREGTNRMTVATPGIPTIILGVEYRLQQLVVNLVNNALHALADRDKAVSLIVEIQGREAVLTVADEGEGMSPAMQARLGTPFFTTRADRGGSGLGWGLCKEIAKEHKGRIELESRPGAGTMVRVRFPDASAFCSEPAD